VIDVLGLDLDSERAQSLAGDSFLAPLLGGDSDLEEWELRPTITEVDYGGAYRKSLIAGSLKYVRSWAPDVEERLFDLAADPGEHANLAEGDPERVAAMRADLERLAIVGKRGWGILLFNRTDQPIHVAGLITCSGSDLTGLDPLHLELKRDGKSYSDGPIGQGWISIEKTSEERGRIHYGTGPSLEEATLATLPELVLTGLRTDSDRGAWFFMVLEPQDTDGVLFVPKTEHENPQVALWVDTRPLPASYVFLGPERTPAESMPLTLGTGAGQEMESAPRKGDGPTDLPMFAWIWKSVDPDSTEIEFTAETEAGLRALGYLDDE
jgi:hypothetical protein